MTMSSFPGWRSHRAEGTQWTQCNLDSTVKRFDPQRNAHIFRIHKPYQPTAYMTGIGILHFRYLFHVWLGGGSKLFVFFTPTWGDDPIWRLHIFQMGWFNHQLVFGEAKTVWEEEKNTPHKMGISSFFIGILATPPKATPPRNKALLWVY